MSPTLASAYLHDLDPFAIRFPQSWGDALPILAGLRWYGLAYAAGFIVGWLWMRWMAKTKRSTLSAPQVSDLLMAMILGVLIGGRLGYVMFYEPHLLGFSSTPPFWGVLALHRGGMSSHGGIIGVIVAAIVFGRRTRTSSLHILDLAAFACLPGLCFGRLANFVNAELWGKALSPAHQANPPWWAVKYPQELAMFTPERAEAARPVAELVGVAGTDWVTAVRTISMLRDQAPDEAVKVVRIVTERVVDAVQSGNEVVAAAVRPLLTSFAPSQLLQALTDGPVLMALLAVCWLRPRRPGVIGALFLTFYGVLRISTEVVRQPDEGVAVWLGLSRGQWLSVAMVLAGLIGLLVVSRRNVPRLGGLRPVVGAAAAA
ncbi:MAG: prolipoprotein diacylglyceryl transferase [Phycisphaerales bacterium]|nr:prolipoprotein diacylglyceryl transferase [Phycisphaerales bacterium]